MPIQLETVQSSTVFPKQVDVVVIGAGVIGTCAAYELARRGVSVALLEKGVVGGEQSSRNWGWIRQQNRELPELPLAIYSVRRWDELSAEIGRDLGFRREGILFCTDKQEELARWEKWGNAARQQGFNCEILTAKQTESRSEGNNRSWLGGVWSPTDGKAEPSLAVPAIAEGAKKLGVHLLQNCAARGLEIKGRDVAGVWTEQGLIKCSAVVCAGGAWSSRFSRRHGIDVPIANVEGTALRTTIAKNVLQAGCIFTPNYALRRRIDGAYTVAVPGYGTVNIAPQGLRYATKFYQMYQSNLTKKLSYRINSSFWNGPEAAGKWEFDEISPFEKIRILDPLPNKKLVDLAIKNLTTDYPELGGIKAAASWGGMIDTTPDLVPIVSKVANLNGFIVAAGFSGHGFTLGPGTGRLITEMVLNETPFTDVAPYSLERFSDGSAIRRPEMM